ncbi:hypothetical protein IPM62_01275 [Candidatus Woesebacteria bacterium]|nr:MAG: hypothetical protein IPM62_01275 [Candidatus Woesebacteria bacterium]
MADKKNFSTIGDLLQGYKSSDDDKYVSREFQKYGYELAKELGDLKNRSLYIKIAKEKKRVHIESARSFIKDAQNVRSKPKLFMWKLQQLSLKKS